MSPTPDATAPGAASPDRGRADACPGALRLHAADDGALARVRLPGGLLTERQAIVLAEAAEQLGDGRLETTSRGNVQLRGLPSDSGVELGRRLRAAGLLPSDTHERVRNIVASPLAGVDADGHADVQAWVRELDERLCAADWAAGLSGKFLFALDDGRGDVAALNADVTLIAAPDGTSVLRLGRADTVHPVPEGQAVPAALRAAREFLDLLRATGTKAWHLREVQELLPPGPMELPVLPATRPRPGAEPGGLSVGMRFGQVDAEQWRLLVAASASAASTASAGRLRLTPWRGAVLPGVGAEWLPRLAEAGFVTEPDSPWLRATACTGLPGCAKSRADVRADAARALEGMPPGLPVHWSGCERRCGHPPPASGRGDPHGEWVDVLATGQGYQVAAGQTSVDVSTEQMAEAVAEARRIT